SPPTTSPLFPYTTLFRSWSIPRSSTQHMPYVMSHRQSFLPRPAWSRMMTSPFRSTDGWRLNGRYQLHRPLLISPVTDGPTSSARSEEHTSELQSRSDIVC